MRLSTVNIFDLLRRSPSDGIRDCGLKLDSDISSLADPQRGAWYIIVFQSVWGGGRD